MTDYKIIRTARAGVFFAKIKKIQGQTVELQDARRLWYWSGAASLSQLAIDGVSDAKNCKFPAAVENMTVFEVIEIIDATEKCVESIRAVKTWAV